MCSIVPTGADCDDCRHVIGAQVHLLAFGSLFGSWASSLLESIAAAPEVRICSPVLSGSLRKWLWSAHRHLAFDSCLHSSFAPMEAGRLPQLDAVLAQRGRGAARRGAVLPVGVCAVPRPT